MKKSIKIVIKYYFLHFSHKFSFVLIERHIPSHRSSKFFHSCDYWFCLALYPPQGDNDPELPCLENILILEFWICHFVKLYESSK